MPQVKNFAFFGEYRYLLQLVAAAVNCTVPPKPPKGLNWRVLLQIAQETAFAPAAFYTVSAMKPEDRPPQAVFEKLYGAFLREASNNHIRDMVLTQLTDFCEQHAIRNMALKGSYIKRFYPQPEMRYMVDIDFLIQQDCENAVHAFLLKNGYKCSAQGQVHNVYQNTNKVTLELHKRLVAKNGKNAPYFEGVWDRAVVHSGKRYAYDMCAVDFYVYMLAHCAHHFFYGGIAPRMLLDFYICRHTLLLQEDEKTLTLALAQTGLTAFEKKMHTLACDWFSPNGKGLTENALPLYIAQNGKMGTVKNIVLTQAAVVLYSGKKVSKGGYILKKLFPPRAALCREYAALQKAPFLYPFFLPCVWYVYLKRALKGEKAFRSAVFVKNLEQEQKQIESLRDIICELEIDHYI